MAVFRYSSRFWLYAPTALFAALAAAVMIHWWMVAGALEKELAALKGREAIPGITLNWDKAEVGGFPFRLDANFQNLRIAGAGAHGPFSWRSDKFAMHGLTYGRSQDVYEAAGRQQISWTEPNGEARAAAFQSGSMRGSSILGPQGLMRFDLDIAELVGPDFTLTRFQFHVRQGLDGNSLDLMISTDGLPVGAKKLEHRQLYVTLTKAEPLLPLLRGEASWPEAVGRWRAGGGSEKVSNDPGTQNLAELLKPLY
ncbi:MAG TPA: DUF2125 domain-containing protein [Rhizomicrobium sp.]|nr:DUF2125 domain-containing protein [Rhizomicrobium sp.]